MAGYAREGVTAEMKRRSHWDPSIEPRAGLEACRRCKERPPQVLRPALKRFGWVYPLALAFVGAACTEATERPNSMLLSDSGSDVGSPVASLRPVDTAPTSPLDASLLPSGSSVGSLQSASPTMATASLADGGSQTASETNADGSARTSALESAVDPPQTGTLAPSAQPGPSSDSGLDPEADVAPSNHAAGATLADAGRPEGEQRFDISILIRPFDEGLDASLKFSVMTPDCTCPQAVLAGSCTFETDTDYCDCTSPWTCASSLRVERAGRVLAEEAVGADPSWGYEMRVPELLDGSENVLVIEGCPETLRETFAVTPAASVENVVVQAGPLGCEVSWQATPHPDLVKVSLSDLFEWETCVVPGSQASQVLDLNVACNDEVVALFTYDKPLDTPTPFGKLQVLVGQ